MEGNIAPPHCNTSRFSSIALLTSVVFRACYAAVLGSLLLLDLLVTVAGHTPIFMSQFINSSKNSNILSIAWLPSAERKGRSDCHML